MCACVRVCVCVCVCVSVYMFVSAYVCVCVCVFPKPSDNHSSLSPHAGLIQWARHIQHPPPLPMRPPPSLFPKLLLWVHTPVFMRDVSGVAALKNRGIHIKVAVVRERGVNVILVTPVAAGHLTLGGRQSVQRQAFCTESFLSHLQSLFLRHQVPARNIITVLTDTLIIITALNKKIKKGTGHKP